MIKLKYFLEHNISNSWAKISEDEYNNSKNIDLDTYDIEQISDIINNNKYNGQFKQNILSHYISGELEMVFDIFNEKIVINSQSKYQIYFLIIIYKSDDDYYKVCVSIDEKYIDSKSIYLSCDQLDNLLMLLTHLLDYIYNKYNKFYEEFKYHIDQFLLKYDIVKDNVDNEDIRKIFNIK